MIDIAQLREENIGDWVEYNGNAGEQERGRIKGWNNSNIFVVYKCAGEWKRFKDFTGQATNPEQLKFVKHLIESQ